MALKADFSIAANSVTTLPNPVVVQKDSLELLFDVKNSGKSVDRQHQCSGAPQRTQR